MQAFREAQVKQRGEKNVFFPKVCFSELTEYSLKVEVLYLNVSLFKFLEIADVFV